MSTPTSNNDSTTIQQQTSKQKAELSELKQKQRREKIISRAIPILLTVPWFIGIIWAALHPLVSVVTGELKCRGQYIDENGLDVHRHRIESYPLERVPMLRKSNTQRGEDTHGVGGMCNAVYSSRLPISSSVECLHHKATEFISFDIVRILPSMGPMIESTEAVVLVVGSDSGTKDWYEGSDDITASILHLIKKLGSKKDCPWLTKTVFIISPTTSNTVSLENNAMSNHSLSDVVDAFIDSYLGGSDSSKTRNSGNGVAVRPLPPDFTFPMIRSVLVLNDVDTSREPQIFSNNNQRTEVNILPQGNGGALPNLDLVFAAFMSFQSHPKGNNFQRGQSIYHGDSDFRIHPFGGKIEKKVGQVLCNVGSMLGLKESSVDKYAKNLSGLFGFIASMVGVGPRQPHASALNHGIDALTIEIRIPGNETSSSIHPHYADLTRCIEHLLRSISNLHERLHHSIAQYTMPSPSMFVSHGEYIYPAILTALPMVIRAATLALRDMKRFQFLHVGMVLCNVCIATSIIGLLAASTNSLLTIQYSFMCYFLLDACRRRFIPQSRNPDDFLKSLRFIACLLGVYFHAPLLLSNYSLGFPSTVFWSPLLATTLVIPQSLRLLLSKNKTLRGFLAATKWLLLIQMAPPFLLVPRIFPQYTSYVIGVYTPLYLLLATLWCHDV